MSVPSRRLAPRSLWWVALAWQSFAGGLFVLGLVDHWLRMRDGEIHDGGVGPLQTPLVVVLGVAAGGMVWRGTAGLTVPWRAVILGVHAGLGFALYVAAAVAYVCGAGIDCF